MNLMLLHLLHVVPFSSLSDMYSGIVAAVGSLKGPLHGGANEQVMSMLADVKSVDEVDAYLDEKFKIKEKSWDSVIEYTKTEMKSQIFT